MTDKRPEINILAHDRDVPGLQAMLTRRRLVELGATGALAAFLAACGSSSSSGGSSSTAAAKTSTIPATAPIESGPLLLANWVDYTDPKNYASYTAKYGPKIVVSGYGSNEELKAKLAAGGSNFDVVVPTGYMVNDLAQSGLIQVLQKQLLPNAKNVEPAFTKTTYDPGNVYSMPKDYGVTSFFYRTDKFPGESPKTLADFYNFTLKYPQKNINWLEGADQNVALALASMGYDINTTDPSKLNEAEALLLKTKPATSTINSTYIDAVSAGTIWAGFGWNGDVARSINTRKAQGKNDLVYVIPDGKTEYWVDNWAVPTASQHPVAAHDFINWMLDPKHAGIDMTYAAYPYPIQGSAPYTDPKIANDPVIVVPNSDIERYQSIVTTPVNTKLHTAIWQKVLAS